MNYRIELLNRVNHRIENEYKKVNQDQELIDLLNLIACELELLTTDADESGTNATIR